MGAFNDIIKKELYQYIVHQLAGVHHFVRGFTGSYGKVTKKPTK